MIDKIGLWWLIAMSLANILIVIYMVGKPRKPLTPGGAVGYAFWSLAYVVFYVHLLGVV